MVISLTIPMFGMAQQSGSYIAQKSLKKSLKKNKHVYEWNKFTTIGISASYYYGSALKISGGAVKRFGFYSSVESNFKYVGEPDYYEHITYQPFLKGKPFCGVFSFTAGGVFRIIPGWMVNIGAGYGRRYVFGKNLADNYILFRQTYISRDGLDLELGTSLYFKKFLFSLGVVLPYEDARLTELNLGVGIIF